MPVDDQFLISYFRQGRLSIMFVVGFWAKNKKKMKRSYKNSMYFYGDWVNGLPQGRAVLYQPLRILIDGDFVDGVPNGRARIIFILKKT